MDRYLEFVAGRCRPNTLRAVAFDLKAFFAVVGKDPAEVTAADVFDFLADQRGDRSVVRLVDRESGLSARTIARRLSSVLGLYAYLIARRWLSSVAQRLATSQARILALLGGSLAAQAAGLLAEETVDGRVELPQRTLAAMLGVARPLLNKVFKDLERDGLIRTSYAAIEVLDRARLTGHT